MREIAQVCMMVAGFFFAMGEYCQRRCHRNSEYRPGLGYPWRPTMTLGETPPRSR